MGHAMTSLFCHFKDLVGASLVSQEITACACYELQLLFYGLCHVSNLLHTSSVLNVSVNSCDKLPCLMQSAREREKKVSSVVLALILSGDHAPLFSVGIDASSVIGQLFLYSNTCNIL